MAKPKDTNDPLTRANDARNALRRLERNQQNSFKRWGDAWKARRAEVLSGIDDDVFSVLTQLGACTAHDAKVRAEAIATRVSQEQHGEPCL